MRAPSSELVGEGELRLDMVRCELMRVRKRACVCKLDSTLTVNVLHDALSLAHHSLHVRLLLDMQGIPGMRHDHQRLIGHVLCHRTANLHLHLCCGRGLLSSPPTAATWTASNDDTRLHTITATATAGV